MEWLVYNIDTQLYTSGATIQLDPHTNGLTIKNGGTSDLVFQRDILSAGQSKAIGGNYGELLKSRLQISFQDPNPAPVGYVRSDLAVVTIKFYQPHLKANPQIC